MANLWTPNLCFRCTCWETLGRNGFIDQTKIRYNMDDLLTCSRNSGESTNFRANTHTYIEICPYRSAMCMHTQYLQMCIPTCTHACVVFAYTYLHTMPSNINAEHLQTDKCSTCIAWLQKNHDKIHSPSMSFARALERKLVGCQEFLRGLPATCSFYVQQNLNHIHTHRHLQNKSSDACIWPLVTTWG